MPETRIAELTIQYEDRGEGPTVLVLPDNIHTSAAHADEISHLAERYRVLCFDYPATGRSARQRLYPDERAVDPWGHWSDIACHLLLEIGVAEAAVLGVGGGARAALHFAGHHARLHGLRATAVVADSFLDRLDARTLHRALDARDHYCVRNAARLAEWHGEDWREVVDEDTAYLRGVADRGGYAVPDHMIRSIGCPLLLSGCLKDPLCPGLAAAYARISDRVADASIHLAGETGHPYLEHPFVWTDSLRFWSVVDPFLAAALGSD